MRSLEDVLLLQRKEFLILGYPQVPLDFVLNWVIFLLVIELLNTMRKIESINWETEPRSVALARTYQNRRLQQNKAGVILHCSFSHHSTLLIAVQWGHLYGKLLGSVVLEKEGFCPFASSGLNTHSWQVGNQGLQASKGQEDQIVL